jgi:hypothetical protein
MPDFLQPDTFARAMATVLDAFAPYMKKLISDMALEEVSMLLGSPPRSPS